MSMNNATLQALRSMTESTTIIRQTRCGDWAVYKNGKLVGLTATRAGAEELASL